MGDQSGTMTAGPENPDSAGFGVYVHWPFCAQKCPYCDFNSHVRHEGWDESRFLVAYRRELVACRERIGPRTVSSIFIGGGTPSLMQPETVAGILDAIAGCWIVAPDAEITLEANPNSVEAERFAGYRQAGINRASIGVQSLRDDQLKALGRLHSVAEARTAIGIARNTFERVSIDLIYARPGQTEDAWRVELAEALSFGLSHLSLYQLTIEPETAFERLHAAGKLVMPDADLAARLFDMTVDMTAQAGLLGYEVSNYARPGQESRHNLLYWRYGEYAGVGPGAHGRIIVDGVRRATSTERHPETWVRAVEDAGHGLIADEKLNWDEQADEQLLMGLRLQEGLDLARLRSMTGLAIASEILDELCAEGLIEPCSAGPVLPDEGFDEIRACLGPGLGPAAASTKPSRAAKRIRVTPKGRLVLNDVVLRLSRSLRPDNQLQSSTWTIA